MDLTNMKKGMFGYNKLAVSTYISNMESEHNQKIQDLQKAGKETEETLRGQIESLREKYEEEIQKLNEKIDELTNAREQSHRDNDTIAGTLLDAKEYAQDLRNKADQNARERDEEHRQVLESQKNRVMQIDTKLNGVLGAITELLEEASKQLNGQAEELEKTGQEIDEEKAKYEPQEEAEEAAAEVSDAEAEALAGQDEAAAFEEVTASEAAAAEVSEAADETSDEAIERAAGRAAEDASDEAEEASGSLVDQWKKAFGDNTSSDEAVSKFTQAAGEIAEKAAVKSE